MESLGVSGGFSGAVIWRVSVAGTELCLRRWPQVHPSLNGLMAMHGLLQHVSAAGFDRVPVPLSTRFGETYFVNEDHLWELTPWLPGKPLLSSAPTQTRLSAALKVLAQFHQLAETYQYQQSKPTAAPSPGLLERLATLQRLQRGELQHFWQATRAAEASDLRELAFELLEGIGHSVNAVGAYLEQVARIPLPLQWCLRDVRHDHILFGDEQVTGLLDFGAVAVESVAGDVARLLGSLANEDQEIWPHGIEAYERHRPLATAERQAIVGFDRGGVICSAANWVRWLFVEGRSFPQIHALHDQLVWLRTRLQALAAITSASVGEAIAGPTWDRSRASGMHRAAPRSGHESPWMHT